MGNVGDLRVEVGWARERETSGFLEFGPAMKSQPDDPDPDGRQPEVFPLEARELDRAAMLPERESRAPSVCLTLSVVNPLLEPALKDPHRHHFGLTGPFSLSFPRLAYRR